jgi:hypothetical protein
LPYLIEGDLKLSQSDTIIRHVARSNNLLGTGSKQQAEVDMLIDFAKDMSAGCTRIVYNPKVRSLWLDFNYHAAGLLSVASKAIKHLAVSCTNSINTALS